MDNKIKAITYGHSWNDHGFLIWHQPNGKGCTATATDPSNMFSIKIVLQILDRNKWQLKAKPIHACPLAKVGDAFGE
jgi:hypothetical protein